MYTECNTNTKTTLIFIYISTMNDAMTGREICRHTCFFGFTFAQCDECTLTAVCRAKTTCHFPACAACAAICAAVVATTFAIVARFASRSAFSSSCCLLAAVAL